MIGQWTAQEGGAQPLSVRIELEDRGDAYVGNAYMFAVDPNLPGFLFPIRLPKEPPFTATLATIFLYPTGGVMTPAERQAAEERLKNANGTVPLASIDVEFSMQGANLSAQWKNGDSTGNLILTKSDPDGPSELQSRGDLTSWTLFREWAVARRPRDFIFRGQRSPHKLVSSFHRTWRKDLRRWTADDVSLLFAAVAERLNYPLQIGNQQHNAALWSILQHHGFPTPLIDWTLSPFVAAFFAFQEIQSGDESAPRIYIFDRARWIERYGKTQFYVDAAPDQLVVMETMAAANPRHVPQQAICTVTNIADVEAFIKRREQEDGISYLTVCDLPADHRPQIMRELELMGITYGSLFPGLDGICRDMRDRLFADPN